MLFFFFFQKVVALQRCCSYKPCLPELCLQEEEQVCGDNWTLAVYSDFHGEKCKQFLH